MKKNAFKLTALTVATSLAITLTGCSDDDDSHEPVEATGQFVDAAVANLDVYQNGEKIDTTDAEGMYTYWTGSEVTFKLGKLTLGSTIAKDIVTPADLSPNTEKVIEILQVLQSLDEDNNLDNGIFIPQTTIDKLVTEFDPTDDDASIIDAVKTDIPDLDLVQEQDAIEHFSQSQEVIEKSDNLIQAADNLKGYWYLGGCDDGEKAIVEMDKVAKNSVQIVGGLVGKYANDTCTGDVISTTNLVPDDDKIKWTVVGTPSDNKINILFENNDDGQQIIPPYLAPIEFNGKVITITSQPTNETYSLSKLDSLMFPDEQEKLEEIEKVANNMVGYWKSDCITNENSSILAYIEINKTNSTTIKVDPIINKVYDNTSCSGNPEAIYKNEADTIDLSKGDLPNIVNNNRFFVEFEEDGEQATEFYNRIEKSDFPVGDFPFDPYEHREANDVVSGKVTFANGIIPDDVRIRITPDKFQKEGNYSSIECEVLGNGVFGSNCYASQTVVDEIKNTNSNTTYQVVVYLDENDDGYWNAGEKTFKVLGNNEAYLSWTNIPID